MPNHLAHALSPYLLQHADNPVDWYPWGPEALQRAKAEQKPIFLSIGYSACHWCHVMAHESFENPQVARLLNDHFVPIKVDREERPDLDQLYMEAVQILTGQGGWPLSAFLTPDLEPFFGGTYWPLPARGGMPGFDQVLHAILDAWDQRRTEVVEQAGRLTAVLRDTDMSPPPESRQTLPARELLASAAQHLARAFDPEHGGFGGAPKFPHPVDLRVLLRWHRRSGDAAVLQIVQTTLEHMAAGGIYDHLGGGFHRYSTDAQWLVPHFEKMLYDNALLAVAYVEAYQVTGQPAYARTARETLDYVLRDMTDPQGGFYSTEDADSEGEEGVYYLWTPAELEAVLGRDGARTFAAVYDVTAAGNFEGRSILHLPTPLADLAQRLQRDPEELEAELADSRRRLLQAREQRVRPGRDDKVLVSWNGLMIDALATAGLALAEPRYVEAAEQAARFLLDTLRDPEGRLRHVWRHGQSQGEGLLEDFASFTQALVTLYEATFDEHWIEAAVTLADSLLQRFADPDGAGFFAVAWDSAEPRIARKKEMLDSSTPSGGGLAVTALVRLGRLCGRDEYLRAAESSLEACRTLIEKAPIGTGQLLVALDLFWGPTPEIVLVGDGRSLLKEFQRRFVPNKVVALRDGAKQPATRAAALDALFAGKSPSPAGPTLFVCEHFTCQEPIHGATAVAEALAKLA